MMTSCVSRVVTLASWFVPSCFTRDCSLIATYVRVYQYKKVRSILSRSNQTIQVFDPEYFFHFFESHRIKKTKAESIESAEDHDRKTLSFSCRSHDEKLQSNIRRNLYQDHSRHGGTSLMYNSRRDTQARSINITFDSRINKKGFNTISITITEPKKDGS